MKGILSFRIGFLSLMCLLPWGLTTASWAAEDRLRVIVETDIGGDADDQASLVRFLLYSNEWDVEAIIADRSAEAFHCDGARDHRGLQAENGWELARRYVEAYGRVYENLAVHKPDYPRPDELLARTVPGFDDADAGVQAIIQAATISALCPNEEYGYEDLWEKTPGQRRAETRRRCAWEIAMAGCYQTTGESARTGTGVEPDTGGGWVNGRGDDSMTMLADYRRLVEFFTAFDWWICQPRNDLVEQQLPCLAVEAVRYIVYLPTGGRATIKLNEGKYRARWFNPRTGALTEAGVATTPAWTSPDTLDGEDWGLLLERDDAAVDRTPPV